MNSLNQIQVFTFLTLPMIKPHRWTIIILEVIDIMQEGYGGQNVVGVSNIDSLTYGSYLLQWELSCTLQRRSPV